MRFATALALGALFAPPLFAQTPARATLVAETGGTVPLPGGGTAVIATVSLPFVNVNGEVGFTGSLVVPSGSEGAVFFDGGLRWRNSDAPPGTTITGQEAWMGVGAAGEFLYSPSVNGEDALWSDAGLLVSRGDPAPGSAGQFITFASRPGMLSGGPAHWISGLASSPTGATTARAFYTSPDRTAGSATIVLAEGQTIGGATVSALDFSYGLSSSGAHRMFIVTRATGSTATDGAVVLDGAVLAQEGTPVAAGTAELWGSFDLVRVNNGGDHLLSGDTNAATGTDEFVAYNGQIALREGTTVAGVPLGAEVRGLALNDAGLAVWAWTTATGTTDEALFVGRATDLAGTSELVLRTGQGLDTNDDGAADFTVADFEFSNSDGHGALSLGAPPVVYARLDLVPAGGGPNRNAIVGLDLSSFAPVAQDAGPARPSLGSLDVTLNPFRTETALTVSVTRAQVITVEAFDALGRRVARIFEGPLVGGSVHQVRWDAGALPGGVYVVRARGEGWAEARRVVRAD